jgi:hypothetical protein
MVPCDGEANVTTLAPFTERRTGETHVRSDMPPSRDLDRLLEAHHRDRRAAPPGCSRATNSHDLMAKETDYSTLSEAHKALPTRLKELDEMFPKLQVRSVCFHSSDPINGGKWIIRVRGHVKKADGVKEISI